MQTKILTGYTIGEHPNPEKVYDWLRNNWHDLSQHVVDDAIESLKAFAQHEGLELDYSISACPDRGEFITFKNVPDDYKMPVIENDCPFTGTYYDHLILDSESLADIEFNVLKTIHSENDYIYSDEGLQELCEANEYHFEVSGTIL